MLLFIRVSVFFGQKVTQAHFHCGQAGTNGAIIVEFFKNDEGKDVNGVLVEGQLRTKGNDDKYKFTPIKCYDVEINNIASLFAAMKWDYIYLNVHAKANTAGEVRGQIFRF